MQGPTFPIMQPIASFQWCTSFKLHTLVCDTNFLLPKKFVVPKSEPHRQLWSCGVIITEGKRVFWRKTERLNCPVQKKMTLSFGPRLLVNWWPRSAASVGVFLSVRFCWEPFVCRFASGTKDLHISGYFLSLCKAPPERRKTLYNWFHRLVLLLMTDLSVPL